MAMYEVTATLCGESDLLQSNPAHSFPSDPLYKLTQPVRSKRQKTEDDYVVLSQLDFLASCHWAKTDDKIEVTKNGVVMSPGWHTPTLPSEMIRSSLAESSKALKNRMGAAFDRGVQVVDSPAIDYDGPKTAPEMWGYEPPEETQGGKHPDSKRVKYYLVAPGSRGGGKLVWITRVRIPAGWSATVQLMCDSSQVEIDELRRMIQAAGQYIGIGSWRPANGGRYGKFKVAEFDAAEVPA
jgi:hypothetical protein